MPIPIVGGNSRIQRPMSLIVHCVASPVNRLRSFSLRDGMMNERFSVWQPAPSNGVATIVDRWRLLTGLLHFTYPALRRKVAAVSALVSASFCTRCEKAATVLRSRRSAYVPAWATTHRQDTSVDCACLCSFVGSGSGIVMMLQKKEEKKKYRGRTKIKNNVTHHDSLGVQER